MKMRGNNGSGCGCALYLLGVLILIWLGTVPSPFGAVPEVSGAGDYRAQVVEIAADRSSLKVMRTDATGRSVRQLSVGGKDEAGKALRELVKAGVCPGDQLHKAGVCPGDLVRITEGPEEGQPVLAKLEIEAVAVPVWQRWLTMIGVALLLLLFAAPALGGDLKQLVVGLDGRYSNSKFQMAVWFGVVMVAYLSMLWLRFCYSGNWLLGAVEVPNNLLALSGLSALSFAGAKVITQGKENALAAAGMRGAMKQPAEHAKLSDLVQDDAGDPDFGDFQMLLITMVAALTYLVQMLMFLGVLELRGKVTLPDADSTLLAAFGLGQGAYLAKKAASGPKPPATLRAGGAGAQAGAVTPPPAVGPRLGVEA
jgi:hypothetical protein